MPAWSSSCIAGTMGTLVTAPVDMIKTRLMLQRETSGARTYRNALHCGYQVLCVDLHFSNAMSIYKTKKKRGYVSILFV